MPEKNKPPRCAAAAWLLAAACVPGAWAQMPDHARNQVPDGASTLHQALDTAWARHPRAAALASRQAEAQARAETAAGFTPQPAAVSVGQKTDRLHDNAGLREWEVEVAAPLWLPGQRDARVTEARRGAQALDAQTAHQRWQLAGEVREAWWALAAARQAHALATQRQETAKALADNVRRRFQAGDLARVDANLAQGESLAAEAELLEAGQALKQAELALRALTGEGAPTDLPPETAGTSIDANEAHPIDHHPWLQALRATSALAGSRVALADASGREPPQIALAWISERSEATRPYERSVGIRLTLPLSSSGRVRQDSAAARADAAQAEAELAQARARVEQDEAFARAAFDGSETLLRMARERQSLTADNFQLAMRGFELGESDLPTLLRARSEDRDAQAALHRQQIARERALSGLLQARGVMP